jgi:hypothetical protein
MQNIRPVLGPGVYTVTKTTMQMPADARRSGLIPGAMPVGAIDFSRVTPRQLHAFINAMINNDRMTVKEGSALNRSIPREWYIHGPDVPVDIRSNIKGIMRAAHGEGSKPLAAFYASLMDRMKLMELQSLPISVVA